MYFTLVSLTRTRTSGKGVVMLRFFLRPSVTAQRPQIRAFSALASHSLITLCIQHLLGQRGGLSRSLGHVYV